MRVVDCRGWAHCPSRCAAGFAVGLQRLQADVWEKLLALPLPAAPSFGLIVTRGHRHDALVLKEWIHRPFVFLGMIGSARKARTMFEHFAEEKLATPEELQRVACPVGVKIRSQSPQEIAVSIMAQFIDKRAELVFERRERWSGGVAERRVCPGVIGGGIG